MSPTDELDLQRAYTTAVESLVKPDQVKIEWEGDGGLLVFGYPEARVDAAETAVRTGLRLIEAVRSVDVVRGVRLEVRAGVASGRVTVDKTRGSLSRVTPVSRAARLMVNAGPGQLLIAEDTMHLVRKLLRVRGSRDPRTSGSWPEAGLARGRRDRRGLPVRRATSRAFAQRDRRPPGRAGQPQPAWAAALQGRGSAVCLVGDSGMGKSRLARAVLDWARRDGAVVLEIDCTPSTGNSPCCRSACCCAAAPASTESHRRPRRSARPWRS